MLGGLAYDQKIVGLSGVVVVRYVRARNDPICAFVRPTWPAAPRTGPRRSRLIPRVARHFGIKSGVDAELEIAHGPPGLAR